MGVESGRRERKREENTIRRRFERSIGRHVTQVVAKKKRATSRMDQLLCSAQVKTLGKKISFSCECVLRRNSLIIFVVLCEYKVFVFNLLTLYINQLLNVNLNCAFILTEMMSGLGSPPPYHCIFVFMWWYTKLRYLNSMKNSTESSQLLNFETERSAWRRCVSAAAPGAASPVEGEESQSDTLQQRLEFR